MPNMMKRGRCLCACMGYRTEEKDCMCVMDNVEGYCVCMHAREKVSGTIIKRRPMCGCKRLGEVIINVKLNSNI